MERRIKGIFVIKKVFLKKIVCEKKINSDDLEYSENIYKEELADTDVVINILANKVCG